MRLADIFLHCNDIESMRKFYSEILTLEESFYSDQYKHLVYKLSKEPEINLVIMETGTEVTNDVWDAGPVFREVDGRQPSWTIRCGSLDELRSVIFQCDDTVPQYFDQPQWVGYWSYMLKDPAGNTVEVYYQYPETIDDPPSWDEVSVS